MPLILFSSSEKSMNTSFRKICGFYFRVLSICFAIFSFIGGIAYAQDLGNLYRPSVISPYWQSDSTSYSFIAVSHPSLTEMASQIGVKLNAITSDKTAFNTAASFTISSGETIRVFIVRTGHSIINPTIIPSGVFIAGTTDYKYGSIIVNPVASHPEIRTSALWVKGNTEGYRDVTMLHFFGGIVFDSVTTGFAMEFIGDTHDSEPIYHTNANSGRSVVATGVN